MGFCVHACEYILTPISKHYVTPMYSNKITPLRADVYAQRLKSIEA